MTLVRTIMRARERVLYILAHEGWLEDETLVGILLQDPNLSKEHAEDVVRLAKTEVSPPVLVTVWDVPGRLKATEEYEVEEGKGLSTSGHGFASDEEYEAWAKEEELNATCKHGKYFQDCQRCAGM